MRISSARWAVNGPSPHIHSFCHRYGHFSASGFRDGDGNCICGLKQNRPSEEGLCDRADREKTAGSGNPHDLAGLPTEHPGGGFACSPDVSACRFGPRVVNSLHAGCRVECETSGLGARRTSSSALLVANGGRRLVLKPKHTKKVLYMEKLSSRGSVEAVCPPFL